MPSPAGSNSKRTSAEPANVGESGPTSIAPDVLRLLFAAVDDAVAGRGRLVLLQYEDEGTVSDVLEETAVHARGSSVRVFRARCELDTRPLFPWLRLVRGCVRGVEFPDSPSAPRFGLFGELLARLEMAAREGPLLLVLEDLHQAERSSLLLLEAIADAIRAWPTALVATYRASRAAPPERLFTETFVELSLDDGCLRLDLSGDGERMAPTDHGVLRFEGDYWTIVFGGRVLRLRDGKGLRYLASLLRRPGQGVHVVDLQDMAGGRERRREGPWADGRVAAERARVAVAKSIKAALERVAEADPELGEHLVRSVRRGYVCSYTPDPAHPIAWRA